LQGGPFISAENLVNQHGSVMGPAQKMVKCLGNAG
jgi:hypothetical protein